MTTLVWFKQDLRISDHQPLYDASKGKVICLYIYEPSLMTAPDHDGYHLAYINASLVYLQDKLAERR